MKKKKMNLLYLTPATAPIFLVGFIQNSIIITIVGFLLLALFVFGGLAQLE
jgi:hypothetical protein